jgi:hypothetical protein
MLTLSNCKQQFKVKVDFQPSRYCKLYGLKNGNFIICYNDAENLRRIELLDKSFKSIRCFEQAVYNNIYYDDNDDGVERSELLEYYRIIKLKRKIEKLIQFDRINTVTTHENKTVLNGSFESKCYLTILNERMQSDLYINCIRYYKSICANSSRIMCLRYDDIIDIFDWKLNRLNEFDISLIHPDSMLMGIQTINNKLLLRRRRSICIINLETFKNVKVIHIKSFQVIIADNIVHVIIRRRRNRYKCFDFNLKGVYIEDYRIENYYPSSYLLCNGKNKFLFNKSSMKVESY